MFQYFQMKFVIQLFRLRKVKRAMFRAFNTQKSGFSTREHLRTMFIWRLPPDIYRDGK